MQDYILRCNINQPINLQKTRSIEKYYFNIWAAIAPAPFSRRIGGFILRVNRV